MSSVWNFIKRHKGKVVTGGIVVGGIYAAKHYLEEHPEVVEQIATKFSGFQQNANSSFSNDGGSSSGVIGSDAKGGSLQLQAKKHYIFDTNQRTCDSSILQLIPNLQEKIHTAFNVEAVAEWLKSSEGVGSEQSEKLDKWNKMKLDAVGRLVAASYGYSLLILSLKTQISILAAQIYEKSQRHEHEAKSGIWQTISSWIPIGLSSGKLAPDSTPVDESNSDGEDSFIQQLFLQSLQYFTMFGMDHLIEKVNAVVKEVLDDVSLKEEIGEVKLREILNEIRSRLEASDCRNFSYYVVPITASQDAFASHNHRLQELLVLLKTVLESQGCRQLISSLVDDFMATTLRFTVNNSPDLRSRSHIPLVKMVPILSDCYPTLSSLQFHSTIQEILSSAQLHQFCVKIFDRDVSFL